MLATQAGVISKAGVRFGGIMRYRKREGFCTEVFQPEAVISDFRERTEAFFHLVSLVLKE